MKPQQAHIYTYVLYDVCCSVYRSGHEHVEPAAALTCPIFGRLLGGDQSGQTRTKERSDSRCVADCYGQASLLRSLSVAQCVCV